jgi:glutamate-1-semialdehyde 2,1-aminomutase
MRATLEKVLTKDNFEKMIELSTYFTSEVQNLFDKYNLNWSINQLGARAEYRFAKPYPKTGTDAYHSADVELEDFLHVYLANRGIMLTPFHNMALMCPTTKREEIDYHTEIFEAAIKELLNV